LTRVLNHIFGVRRRAVVERSPLRVVEAEAEAMAEVQKRFEAKKLSLTTPAPGNEVP
jgi:hypothetical protein